MLPIPYPAEVCRRLSPDQTPITAYTEKQLISYANQCIAAERERCAMLCEREGSSTESFDVWLAGYQAACLALSRSIRKTPAD